MLKICTSLLPMSLWQCTDCHYQPPLSLPSPFAFSQFLWKCPFDIKFQVLIILPYKKWFTLTLYNSSSIKLRFRSVNPSELCNNTTKCHRTSSQLLNYSNFFVKLISTKSRNLVIAKTKYKLFWLLICYLSLKFHRNNPYWR